MEIIICNPQFYTTQVVNCTAFATLDTISKDNYEMLT